MSGLSIGYAIRNSTKTAAGNELTDLELIEVAIVARGANDRGSGRVLDRLRELQRPLACLLKCGSDGVPEVGLIDRAPVPRRVPQRRPDELVAV